MRRALLALSMVAVLPIGALAQDITLHGYADIRAVVPTDETSWNDGGLGKSRYGGGSGIEARFAGAALAGTWQFAPSWLAVADMRVQADASPHVDLLDVYLRFRPASMTPWRWSLKLGAFFPPISLENDGIGWTSTWTLTPSAINSWVGEELRTIGAEFSVEHRGDAGTLEAGGAVFTGNDPAGELLFARGWSLSDLTSGIGTHVREPDVYTLFTGSTVPVGYKPFGEIDHRLGWYADASWKSPAYGQVTLMRYDNRADPKTYQDYEDRQVFAWHTRFWSLGAKTRIGDVVLIAQAMNGTTIFEPAPDFSLEARFQSAYLLAGWDRGAWRPALRIDFFNLYQSPTVLDSPLSEHGNALTLALNWRPRDWLRVTGEMLRIDSVRAQRLLEGLSARQIDNQVQLGVRVLF